MSADEALALYIDAFPYASRDELAELARLARI